VKHLLVLVAVVGAVTAAACKKPSGSNPAPPATQAAAKAPEAPPAPKPLPEQLPDVLARVNGQEVKKADFDMLVRDLELGQGPIPAERRTEVLRGTLDQLVTYTLLKQEAAARSITATDAEVDARIAQMRQQFPNEEAFKSALGQRNMSVERLRNDTRNDIVITKMMDAEVASEPACTDAEAKDFYEKNPDKFQQPELVRASHILLKVDASAPETAKKKVRAQIDGLLKRAKAGEDFAKLARAHSQDGSAAQGGDLGPFPRGQMVPPFDEAAFALKPGELSGVVTTQFGYHIIKVTDRTAASVVPLEQVNERVKQVLTNQKKQQHATGFIASLKQKSKIEVLV
jgi:peptidyl-prolyl cis-trans isomerase C